MNLKTVLPSAKGLGKAIVSKIGTNKDTVFTVLGVVGLVSSVIMAFKAGPVVKERLEDAEADKYEEEYDKIMAELDLNDVVEGLADEFSGEQTPGVISPSKAHQLAEERMALTWQEKAPIIFEVMWPTMVSVVVTAGCIILSNRISTKRYSTLMAAYAFSEDKIKDIQDKIIEEEGPKRLKKYEDEIEQDKVFAEPQIDPGTAIQTGYGSTLFKEYYSGRWFYSDIEQVRRQVIDFERIVRDEGEGTLNDWCDCLNIPHMQEHNNTYMYDEDYGEYMIITNKMIEKYALGRKLELKTSPCETHNQNVAVHVVRLNVDFKHYALAKKE